MANNRELSQLGSIVNINDSNRTLGIAASVGIGTTVADYQLHVQGDINFTDNLYKNGELFTSGVGAGVGAGAGATGLLTTLSSPLLKILYAIKPTTTIPIIIPIEFSMVILLINYLIFVMHHTMHYP